MLGHVEQVLMKLNILEKQIEGDRKNLKAQSNRAEKLEKEMKNLNVGDD